MASRQDVRTPGQSSSHASSSSTRSTQANGSMSSRKRSSKDEGEPQRKKSKGKSKAAFNPQPLQRATEDDDDIPIPPPPASVRRTATSRMRDQAAAAASPAPARVGSAGPPAGFDDDDEDDEGEHSTRAPSMFGQHAREVHIQHLEFKPLSKPRASMAPPPSPAPSMPPPPRSVSKRAPRRSMRPEQLYTDSVVPINVSDTPVIRKNRDMRKSASRRSSMGMRGQRGSSSFDRGEPSYPHSTVPHTQLYKHIPPDRPEPQKARWLVTWCAKRALEEHTGVGTRKGKQRATDPETATIDNLLSGVMEDFIGKFTDPERRAEIDTNVFPPPGDHTPSMPVRPHPRNVENKKIQDKMNVLIKRMKTEDRDWSRLSSAANHTQATVNEECKAKLEARRDPDVSGTDAASVWFRDALEVADEVLASGDLDIGSAADFAQVEYEVDTLLHASHRANQYSQQSKRFLDGIFASLTADLRAREGTGALPPTDSDAPDTVTLLATASSAPTARSDPISMLRALASADAKNPSSDALSRVQTMGAPRQSTIATPRKSVSRRSIYGGRGTPAGR